MCHAYLTWCTFLIGLIIRIVKNGCTSTFTMHGSIRTNKVSFLCPQTCRRQYTYLCLFNLNCFIFLFQARRERKSRKDRLCPWQTFWAHRVDPTRQKLSFQRTQVAGLTRYCRFDLRICVSHRWAYCLGVTWDTQLLISNSPYVTIHTWTNLISDILCSWWHVSDYCIRCGYRLTTTMMSPGVEVVVEGEPQSPSTCQQVGTCWNTEIYPHPLHHF